MRWTRDQAKNEMNLLEHGINLGTATLVFDDPYPDESRWSTMGRTGSVVVMVVHAWPEGHGGAGRIISARKATRHERKAYEEGEF